MEIEPPREVTSSDQVARDFRARLLRFIRARVDNAADAEDIAQEVLLRMHRSIQTLTASDRLGAWLFQVANNAIVDHYRSRGRAAAVIDPHVSADTAADDAAGQQDEDPKRFERDATRCLDAFIDQLDARQAQALRLVDVGGLTNKEAAERIGLSVPGVKSRVQRARTSLKKALTDCCALDFSRSDGLIEFDATGRTCSSGCGGPSRRGSCAPPDTPQG